MRMAGILVVALIVVLAYKFYFSQLKSDTGSANPVSAVSAVGVQNDLLAIAQAERAYQAEHGSYASLDELSSSGSLTMKKTGRDGYTYRVETTPGGFRAVAQCPSDTNTGCSSYAIDQSLQIQRTQ
jgi:hypothetical protein